MDSQFQFPLKNLFTLVIYLKFLKRQIFNDLHRNVQLSHHKTQLSLVISFLSHHFQKIQNRNKVKRLGLNDAIDENGLCFFTSRRLLSHLLHQIDYIFVDFSNFSDFLKNSTRLVETFDFVDNWCQILLYF